MRNFIWTGNVNERKIFMVAYKNVCYPITSGCLGLMSLKNQNQATNEIGLGNAYLQGTLDHHFKS